MGNTGLRTAGTAGGTVSLAVMVGSPPAQKGPTPGDLRCGSLGVPKERQTDTPVRFLF